MVLKIRLKRAISHISSCPDMPAARAPIIIIYQVSMLAGAHCAHLNAQQVTHTLHALTQSHLGFMSDAPADIDFPLTGFPCPQIPNRLNSSLNGQLFPVFPASSALSLVLYPSPLLSPSPRFRLDQTLENLDGL